MRRLAAFRVELPVLAVLAAASLAVWAFIELADEVLEHETHAFDRFVLLALRSAGNPDDPLGPPWVEEMARDFTALGGIGVLVLVSAAALAYLMMLRRRHAALLVLVTVAGGLLLSSALKYAFDRPRPDLVAHGSLVYSASFPSGHSMMSAVVYLTLAALLARQHAAYAVKAFLLGAATALTVLVGMSRVYLGVHWPTDVLAGWAAGAGWALAAWFVALWLQRRGAVEPA